MGKAEIATILALCAALCVAIGDVIQQRSAQTVTDEPVGHAALFLQLLRDWKWWVGSLVAGGGFVFQAAALGFGSVLLVQALMVTSLLFALPISARYAGRRVTRWQWIWRCCCWPAPWPSSSPSATRPKGSRGRGGSCGPG